MSSFGDDGGWQGDKMSDTHEGGQWIGGDFYYSTDNI
jgi:hypothetical protein